MLIIQPTVLISIQVVGSPLFFNAKYVEQTN